MFTNVLVTDVLVTNALGTDVLVTNVLATNVLEKKGLLFALRNNVTTCSRKICPSFAKFLYIKHFFAVSELTDAG